MFAYLVQGDTGTSILISLLLFYPFPFILTLRLWGHGSFVCLSVPLFICCHDWHISHISFVTSFALSPPTTTTTADCVAWDHRIFPSFLYVILYLLYLTKSCQFPMFTFFYCNYKVSRSDGCCFCVCLGRRFMSGHCPANSFT